MAHIKRPPNTWIIFRSQRSREIHQEYINSGRVIDAKTISKLVSAEFSQLSSAAKADLQRRRLDEKREHQERYPGYKFQPNKATESKRKMEQGSLGHVRKLRSTTPTAGSSSSPTQNAPFSWADIPADNYFFSTFPSQVSAYPTPAMPEGFAPLGLQLEAGSTYSSALAVPPPREWSESHSANPFAPIETQTDVQSGSSDVDLRAGLAIGDINQSRPEGYIHQFVSPIVQRSTHLDYSLGTSSPSNFNEPAVTANTGGRASGAQQFDNSAFSEAQLFDDSILGHPENYDTGITLGDLEALQITPEQWMRNFSSQSSADDVGQIMDFGVSDQVAIASSKGKSPEYNNFEVSLGDLGNLRDENSFNRSTTNNAAYQWSAFDSLIRNGSSLSSSGRSSFDVGSPSQITANPWQLDRKWPDNTDFEVCMGDLSSLQINKGQNSSSQRIDNNAGQRVAFGDLGTNGAIYPMDNYTSQMNSFEAGPSRFPGSFSQSHDKVLSQYPLSGGDDFPFGYLDPDFFPEVLPSSPATDLKTEYHLPRSAELED
ncbi:hypothetical protein D9757_004967 [Collybiopsis confluens]|uniref:HMG box domain-containing protein n=1 Tax=Collybiopsis confluens TaxID=2823264 RepID=A0A8H5MCM1_9AGAR|nr:hypothetical protein D9757_004967 [Collybiopsis confluens]